MVKTISENDFVQAFKDMNRENNFSEKGLRALYNYLEDVYADNRQPIELDVIAICCEWTEYESFEAIQEAYEGIKTMQDLENNTQVITIEDSNAIIIQNY